MTEQIGQKVSFINSTESGNVHLEGQTEHEHSQFTRLVANWDTLSAKAKIWMVRQATEHKAWVAELDPEHQQLILNQIDETFSQSISTGSQEGQS
jgi:Tfp pilus tip-associated adhesin PilY1